MKHLNDAAPTISTTGQDYWSIVRKQMKKNRVGMAGFYIVLSLVVTALLAPLIANDRPIVARYKGETYFPAFPTYVDIWVPWQSMRYKLKSWKWGNDPGFFPFSDYYSTLEEKPWKAVKGTAELTLALWPPVQWNPNQFDKTALKQKPSLSSGHLFGTDDQGRDVLARLLHGTVVAIMVGIVATGISALIGITLGLIAGFSGGVVDLLLSRLTEIVMCFPTFFLIIAVIAFLEPSILNIMAVIGFTSWPQKFRLIRGEVLRCRNLDYIVAAQSSGIPNWRIMLQHVLPNAVAPVFVAMAFSVAGAVLYETSLSFLGFGDPSVPSWGETVSQGRVYVSQGLWHLTIYPGLAIFLTLTAFNLFGQGLRDAMDPKLRH